VTINWELSAMPSAGVTQNLGVDLDVVGLVVAAEDAGEFEVLLGLDVDLSELRLPVVTAGQRGQSRRRMLRGRRVERQTGGDCQWRVRP
jgi:hypothetical protein